MLVLQTHLYWEDRQSRVVGSYGSVFGGCQYLDHGVAAVESTCISTASVERDTTDTGSASNTCACEREEALMVVVMAVAF